MNVAASAQTTPALAGLGPQEGPLNQSSMDFYNLLTTQLTNQNPLEPMKETEFLGQMAQFSTVEQLQGVSSTLQSSQAEQRWLDAQDFLGRQISWKSGDEAPEQNGTVDRIHRDAEGALWLTVGQAQVSPEQVTAVAPGAGRPGDYLDVR
ncbi:MAG: flagellar hook assembly protein FlgD [Opitutales bacterium]